MLSDANEYTSEGTPKLTRPNNRNKSATIGTPGLLQRIGLQG